MSVTQQQEPRQQNHNVQTWQDFQQGWNEPTTETSLTLGQPFKYIGLNRLGQEIFEATSGAGRQKKPIVNVVPTSGDVRFIACSDVDGELSFDADLDEVCQAGNMH